MQFSNYKGNNIGRDTDALITDGYIKAQHKVELITLKTGNEACEHYDVGELLYILSL